MFFLKACSKCHGDLVVEGGGIDRWGEPADIVCIQCGHAARPAEREILVHKAEVAMQKRGLASATEHRRLVGVR